MRNGDSVEIVDSHWNCSVTSKFIGEVGILYSANSFGFCEVSIKSHRETFHKDELAVIKKPRKKK